MCLKASTFSLYTFHMCNIKHSKNEFEIPFSSRTLFYITVCLFRIPIYMNVDSRVYLPYQWRASHIWRAGALIGPAELPRKTKHGVMQLV